MYMCKFECLFRNVSAKHQTQITITITPSICINVMEQTFYFCRSGRSTVILNCRKALHQNWTNKMLINIIYYAARIVTTFLEYPIPRTWPLPWK